MKIFLPKICIHKLFTFTILVVIGGSLHSCATHRAQYGKMVGASQQIDAFESEHDVFLIGDAGNINEEEAAKLLPILEQKIEKANANSTLIFLGDNIYPKGLPSKEDPHRSEAENKLNIQLNLAKKFKGKSIFMPGNHDYYSGLKGVKAQEKYINEALSQKKSFMPRNGCGIDDIQLNDNLAMIVIDSQWFLENWDQHNAINEKCDIKTRDQFFEELEGLLNDFQDQTILLAIHHPLFSNGSHGGQFSLRKQLFPLEKDIPLPIIGSLINEIRKTSGISPQDIQNIRYSQLVNRIKTLIQSKDNVVVISGHDHNLQYIEKDNIRQIISGSGSKTEAARAINSNDFSYGGNGFAILSTSKDQGTNVTFYGVENQQAKILFSHQVLPEKKKFHILGFPEIKDSVISSQIYPDELTKKSSFYNFLWGKKYREYYSKPIMAPVANLDTLYGGLSPIKAGGGHQSKSLRVQDSQKRQFVVRALKKSATRFIQSVAFKNQFVENDFRETYAENFLLDFYTSSHPYFPFVVGELADPLAINHTNPKLFYVPKQMALQEYNEDFGDELYMIEERPSNGFLDLESFGKPQKIVSTDEVLANLRKDEKYNIDEKAYIRVRLFDMLIGDWDRHADQWRWGEHEQNGTIYYKPIPRDRDQAFASYNGTLLALLMKMPALRHMQSFKKDIRNVKWFNMEPYPMDVAFLKNATVEDWQREARFIAENLTEEKINSAFAKLPLEVQDKKVDEIKKILAIRKTKLENYAKDYYNVLAKTVILTGTDKKDQVIIDRIEKGKTKITINRLKKTGIEQQFEKIYAKKDTKEIWIYTLNDEDKIEVKGTGKSAIKVRILGGLDADTYEVENGIKVKIYDFESEKNNLQKAQKAAINLRDNYELNTYDYKRPKYNFITAFPSAGYNPDDGVKIGLSTTYTVNGFKRNPFSQKHNIKLNYFFATSGYEAIYKAIFPNMVNKWYLEFDARITSSNFSSNFFGYGNESVDMSDEFGMNYNRVRTKIIGISPSYNWKGDTGGYVNFKTKFDAIKVDETNGRIMAIPNIVSKDVFKTQYYGGISAEFGFKNFNKEALPTLGFHFNVEGGSELNIDKTHLQVPFLSSKLTLINQLDHKGKIVFSTDIATKMIFENDFQFYQMVSLGGDQSLRGYRNERFYGKQMFYQSSDLRVELIKFKKLIAPIKFGISTGFDYGRVWLPGEKSNIWHTSYGGGIWLSGVDVITGKVGYFQSPDGGRITFGFSVGF